MNNLSIVIPTYNNCNLLCRCIDSVLNQTYPYIEIIVVDDGSTDDTKNIVKKYNKLSNFKYIYQNNSGVSAARNRGIKESNCEYIMFLDSDDFYDKDYCEKMINSIVNNNSDMCVSGINYIKNNNFFVDFYKTNKSFDKINIINFISDNICNYLLYPVWNKIYKVKLLSNISFNKNLKIGEDFVFNLEYIKNCKNISYVANNFYNYVMSDVNTTSQMKKYNTIISIKNEIKYSQKIDEYLIMLGFNEKLLEKRRKWNYSLSYNKVCNNIFAANNPYTKQERKNILKKLRKSLIGKYARKNYKNKIVFILSHSIFLSYFIFSKKNSSR